MVDEILIENELNILLKRLILTKLRGDSPQFSFKFIVIRIQFTHDTQFKIFFGKFHPIRQAIEKFVT